MILIKIALFLFFLLLKTNKLYIIIKNVKKGEKMYYPYNLTVVKPKMNKWKIFIIVVIVLAIILLSIYGGIKYAKYIKAKKQEEELQKEQELLKEQKKIEEEKEAKRLKNSQPLTEEQMRKYRKYIYVRRKKSILNL